jgi:hypothetical protein
MSIRYRDERIGPGLTSDVYVDATAVRVNEREAWEWSGDYTFADAPRDEWQEPTVSPVTSMLTRMGFLPRGTGLPRGRKP